MYKMHKCHVLLESGGGKLLMLQQRLLATQSAGPDPLVLLSYPKLLATKRMWLCPFYHWSTSEMLHPQLLATVPMWLCPFHHRSQQQDPANMGSVLTVSKYRFKE
jgi:hypothetical protein